MPLARPDVRCPGEQTSPDTEHSSFRYADQDSQAHCTLPSAPMATLHRAAAPAKPRKPGKEPCPGLPDTDSYLLGLSWSYNLVYVCTIPISPARPVIRAGQAGGGAATIQQLQRDCSTDSAAVK